MNNKIFVPVLLLIMSFTVVSSRAEAVSVPASANSEQVRCANISATSDIGSTGQAVVALQTALINQGFNIPAISASKIAKGYYGLQTRTAVQSYQKREGIAATGSADLATITRLNESGCSGSGNANISAIKKSIAPVANKSAVTVVSPNGGEIVVKGSTTTINWRDSRVPEISKSECFADGTCYVSMPFPKYYDIRLEAYYPPCTEACPWYVKPNPFIIDRNISALSQGSYNWNSGLIEASAVGSVVSDGRYMISVCQSGTSVCDTSDKYFNLITK